MELDGPELAHTVIKRGERARESVLREIEDFEVAQSLQGRYGSGEFVVAKIDCFQTGQSVPSSGSLKLHIRWHHRNDFYELMMSKGILFERMLVGGTMVTA